MTALMGNVVVWCINSELNGTTSRDGLIHDSIHIKQLVCEN